MQHNIVHKVQHTTLFTRCSTQHCSQGAAHNIVHKMQHNIVHKVQHTTLFTRCSTTSFTRCSTQHCSQGAAHNIVHKMQHNIVHKVQHTTLFTRCSTQHCSKGAVQHCSQVATQHCSQLAAKATTNPCIFTQIAAGAYVCQPAVFISLVITYLTAINLPISRSELIVSCLMFAYKILRKLGCFLRRLACDQVKMTKTRYFACPDELNNILVGLWG